MKKVKCFIVDDDPVAVRSLELLLSQIDGVEVMGSFTDSVKATYEIVLRKPDIVFLDINMPGLDGFEFLETLEKAPKIIIVTGTQKEIPEDLKDVICDSIQKPVPDKERLAEAVTRAMDMVTS